MSDSVRPHRWQPTRLRRPWESPGKNTGVGCHFLLQCMKVKTESEVTQSCPTLSDPMDCSPPGSSIPGIFQARVLEWGAIAFSIIIGDWNAKVGSDLLKTTQLIQRRRWHPTPVLLPGKSHGWRSLVGCSPWGRYSQARLSDFTFTFHFHALEKEMATHSSVLAWRIPGTGSLVGCRLWGRTESDTTEATQQQQKQQQLLC